MVRTRVSLGVALGCALVAVGLPAPAQEEPPAARAIADWAPRWRKGDWWVVRTYQKDLRARLSGPAPADGGAPPPVADPFGEALPGYPPLRDGVPEGWKAGNRFRLEALRRELVRYPDDAPTDAPEAFVVVGARTLEGEPARTAELWYAEADLTLAKVVTDPGEKGARTWELSGTALLEPPVSEVLGLPLDWPDFAAAKEAERELTVGARRLEQRMRVVGAGTDKEEVQVRLAEVAATPGRPTARVLFSFRRGAPFWTRLVAANVMGELVEQGRAGR